MNIGFSSQNSPLRALDESAKDILRSLDAKTWNPAGQASVSYRLPPPSAEICIYTGKSLDQEHKLEALRIDFTGQPLRTETSHHLDIVSWMPNYLASFYAIADVNALIHSISPLSLALADQFQSRGEIVLRSGILIQAMELEAKGNLARKLEILEGPTENNTEHHPLKLQALMQPSPGCLITGFGLVSWGLTLKQAWNRTLALQALIEELYFSKTLGSLS